MTRRPKLKASSVPKRQLDKDWGNIGDENSNPSCPTDEELPGTIFAVPDRNWGFEAVGREDHPGVLMNCRSTELSTTFIKGRDAATDCGSLRSKFIVEPTRNNGLRKSTSFELVPRFVSLRHVRLWTMERRIGTLEQDVFSELRRRLKFLFPAQE